jgi:hypothetical protein
MFVFAQIDFDTQDIGGDGSYMVGLRVSCASGSYVSDTADLVIDRKPPQVLRHLVSPAGRSLTVKDAISASFSEPINCDTLVLSAILADGTALVAGTHFTLTCAGDRIQLLLDEAQVGYSMLTT